MRSGASEQVMTWLLPFSQVLDLLFQVIGLLSHLIVQDAGLCKPFSISGVAWPCLTSSFHFVILSCEQSTHSFSSIIPMGSDVRWRIRKGHYFLFSRVSMRESRDWCGCESATPAI